MCGFKKIFSISMQGIQFFEYKNLKNALDKLQNTEEGNLPAQQPDAVIEYDEKLNEIYGNYRLALQEVALVIKQFEEHKLSIRRLVASHKQHTKTLIKKQESALR